MGFGSAPKPPKPDPELRRLQIESLQASIDKSREKLPAFPTPKPMTIAPPAQQTAQDVAAAERAARIEMSKKKGIAWSQNPNSGMLGGASSL
jgi:hypothetical protein